VLAALLERNRTGRGRVVRTSLLASIVGVLSYQGARYTVAGDVPKAIGNHHAAIAPYGLFHTATAPVQVAVGSEGLWRRFAPVADLDVDDPRFASNPERVAHRDDLVAEIERAFAKAPAEEWLQKLADAGVPAGKVRTLDDVFAWEQTLSQGLLIDVDTPTGESAKLPGPPLRFDDNTHAGGRDEHLAPPRLGEHDDSVRAWLDGLDGAAGGQSGDGKQQ
jgi:crotonobetainyl-CoA:carnitine CoA-transferase CaiB-like acyl-CoA transferase